MVYSAEERETTCVYDFKNDEWTVYSCVPRHMSRLRKIAEPYWEEKKDGRVTAAKWRLKGNQVRFAVEYVSKMSPEQREAARLRMKRRHEMRKE